MVVGVTGATGFLGRHIVHGLLEEGLRVVGIVRRPERGADLADAGVELVRADLLDPDALRTAVSGLDAVVSNASIAVTREPGEGVRAHAELEGQAIANLARASLDAGVERFVHISSVAGCPRVPLGRPGLEGEPRRGMARNLASWFFRRGYGEAKARVEERLEAIGDLRLTVLRPGPIYGSGDTKVLEDWGRWLQGPLAIVPDVRVPFVHAGDVAAAVVGALGNPDTVGRVYNVTGPPHSLAEVSRTLRRLLGIGGPTLAIPLPVRVRWSNEAAERDLGIVFRPVETGLRESVRNSPTIRR